jgi:hypothetical protein
MKKGILKAKLAQEVLIRSIISLARLEDVHAKFDMRR